MNAQDKFATLMHEINLIDNYELKSFVAHCVCEAPDYFFTMPASTTGKYHPEYSLGEGGLVRHTQAAVKIAADLLSLEQYKKLNKDTIIAALILHDSIKKGFDGSKYTAFSHPLDASEFLAKQASKRKFKGISEQVDNVRRLIESHMGQWNEDKRSPGITLPKPLLEDEKLVHLCDYLASRRYITCDLTITRG